MDDSADGEGVTSLMKLEFAEKRIGRKIKNLTEAEQKQIDERLIEIINKLLEP